ncbi:hypothetical protein D3C81_1555530 [compost metagenome]
MHHHQPALLARHRQHLKDLAVVQLQVVVGHVDLERRIALADQPRQLVLQHGMGRVGNDQVESIVDHRLAAGAAMVVVHRRAQRMTFFLRGKRDHGGGAAAGGRDRAGAEVVGHPEAVGHGLVQVAVRIDAARQHQLAARVDDLRGFTQVKTELHDAAAVDGDIALHGVAGGHHGAVADDQVELFHDVGHERKSRSARGRAPAGYERSASDRCMRAVSRAAAAATAISAHTTAR